MLQPTEVSVRGIPQPSVVITPRATFRAADEFTYNYGLGRINADAAYSRGYFGQGVTVGVMDTGMRTSHLDLRDNVVAGRDFVFDTPIIDDPITSFNSIGHGTAVAGIIAAARNNAGGTVHGVAPQAKLMPLQFGDAWGRLIGDPATAFRWATGRNVHIINNSWGTSQNLVGQYNGVRYHFRSPAFSAFGFGARNSIASAVRGRDVVLVWAAGNNGWNNKTGAVVLCRDINAGINPAARCPSNMRLILTPQQVIDGFVSEAYNAQIVFTITAQTGVNAGQTQTFSFNEVIANYGALATLGLTNSGTGLYPRLPYSHPELADRWLVAVATDANDQIADFSNGCGDAMFWCLAAPGWNIPTTAGTRDDGYASAGGTSFAAPHVSGALAVLKSRLPSMPMAVARAVLLYTAKDLTPNDGARLDSEFGWGLVDLARAITLQGDFSLATPFAPPPPPPPASATIDVSGPFAGVAASYILPPPNTIIAAASTFRTTEFTLNYALRQINADAAYARGYFGQGVTVGIVDTGMLTSHIDLRDNVVPGYDFASDRTVITDGAGHGTFIAGIVAAARNNNGIHGVAPQAKLMPLQLGNQSGEFVADENLAFRYGLDRNVRIFNNSYGPERTRVLGTYQGRGLRWALMPWFAPLIGSTSGTANTFHSQFGNEDAVWVWAAGNDDWRTGGSVVLCSNLNPAETCPSGFRETVAITDLLDNFTADCSNQRINRLCGLLSTIRVTVNGEVLRIPESGADFYPLFPYYQPELASRWLAVVATDANDNLWDDPEPTTWEATAAERRGFGVSPRRGITYFPPPPMPQQLRLGVGRGSGTSFATPYVSGALAVLKSRLTSMPMHVVRAVLLHTARDLTPNDGARVDVDFGWGLVDLEKAITLQGEARIISSASASAAAAADEAKKAGGARIMDARIRLSPAFAGARGELNKLSVAVSVFGGAHYNTALGALAEVDAESETRAMRRSECWAAKKIFASAREYFLRERTRASFAMRARIWIWARSARGAGGTIFATPAKNRHGKNGAAGKKTRRPRRFSPRASRAFQCKCAATDCARLPRSAAKFTRKAKRPMRNWGCDGRGARDAGICRRRARKFRSGKAFSARLSARSATRARKRGRQK